MDLSDGYQVWDIPFWRPVEQTKICIEVKRDLSYWMEIAWNILQKYHDYQTSWEKRQVQLLVFSSFDL